MTETRALIYVKDDGTIADVILVGKNVTPVDFQVVGELPASAPNTTPEDLMDRFFGDGRVPRI